MNTLTRTSTQTDIRKVFEKIEAELRMIAIRTQAMSLDYAQQFAHDIFLMARVGCLSSFHVQLRDYFGNLVRVHRYSVQEVISSALQRPGGNRWPCLPGGTLNVLVEPPDDFRLERLKKSGKLKLVWSPSTMSTDYSGMRSEGERLYSSNSYGLRRATFVT